MTVEPGPGGRHQLVVTGLDATHRLARGPKTRSFQNMTDADIVSQIARDYDLDTDVDATPEVYEYVLQHSQTDYAFLRDRGEHIGFDLYVADGTLFFKRHPESRDQPPALTWGDNLHGFRVRFSAAERCDEVTVRGWDAKNKATIVGRSDQGDTGLDGLGVVRPLRLGAAGVRPGLAVRGPVPRVDAAGGRRPGRVAAAEGLRGRGRAEGRGPRRPHDRGGGHGRARARSASGCPVSYQVTSVEHVYGGDAAYVTRFVCGGKEPAFLADLVGGGGNGAGPKRGWGSLVIGLVTNCDDPEQRGRVKVKFPTLSDNDESAWARVCSPGAGPDRGHAARARGQRRGPRGVRARRQAAPRRARRPVERRRRRRRRRRCPAAGSRRGCGRAGRSTCSSSTTATSPSITLTHGTASSSLHLEKDAEQARGRPEARRSARTASRSRRTRR